MPRKEHIGSRFEDEGVPDLQDGTPEQQWMRDPQEAPLPGDMPLAVDDWGTTAAEQRGNEPLDRRLSREEPEVGAEQPDRAGDQEPIWAREGDEPTNLYNPTGEHAGRLIAPDEGAHPTTEADLIAAEQETDSGGYTAEEGAMRIEPEDRPVEGPGWDGPADG
jgi:Family of unknown function (DUF5709)